MKKQSVNDNVAAWLGGEYTMFDACTEEPETAWLAILKILCHDLTEEQIPLLAAGPLETLLSWHGMDFIDRIEDEARRNPRFNHLLGGVWQCDMPKELWERVQKARSKVW